MSTEGRLSKTDESRKDDDTETLEFDNVEHAPAINYEEVGEEEDTKDGVLDPSPAHSSFKKEHAYHAISVDNACTEDETDATSNLLAAVQELRDEHQVEGTQGGMRLVFSHHDNRHHDEDDHTNSTISTLEASGQSHEDSHIKAPANETTVLSNDIDIPPFTADSNTLEWLNNSVAVAISNGVLPVTCKQLKGELHLNKFGSGNRGKCISAYSQWFTPTEFEAFAGRAQCKDWKRSIKLEDRALLQLIELNILKVHAVSCTCPACWNGESSGPVRLHDTKRKTSSFSFCLPSKRDRPDDTDSQKKCATPVFRAKRARAESTTSIAEPSTPVPCSSATSIVQSPGGTLRLVTQGGSHNPQPVRIVTQGGSGQPQTISLMLQPPQAQSTPTSTNPVRTPSKTQQTIYVSVPGSAGSSTPSGGGGIPLGLTYAPVQVMSQAKCATTTTTASSSNSSLVNSSSRRMLRTERPVVDIFEQLTGFEKVTANLQLQVNQLQQLIFGLRQKTEKAMQDMRHRTLREKENEIHALKKALSQMQQASQQESPDTQHDSGDKKLCENCNRVALMACGLCHQAFYCSEFCATKDMENHKRSCRNESDPNPVEMVNID